VNLQVVADLSLNLSQDHCTLFLSPAVEAIRAS
jgi:hypothetical protein